jgi:hypothetical protein
MAKTVTLIFDDAGEQPTEVDMEGWHGSGCRAVAKAFCDALGTTVSSKDKPEALRESNVSRLTNG